MTLLRDIQHETVMEHITPVHYSVEIKINHQSVLYISSNELSGVDNISDYAEEIRHIANSLLGFIGEKNANSF